MHAGMAPGLKSCRYRPIQTLDGHCNPLQAVNQSSSKVIAMSADATIHALNIQIPTLPKAIQQLTGLLANPAHQAADVCAVIESDMGLAASVLRVVNSSLFGFAGKVQTVRHALTYLGTQEVAALTLQMGLRAAFPRSVALDALWERSAARARAMTQLGGTLCVDPWVAHSAGLFEECGKAVFLRHAPERYGALLASVDDDQALIFREHEMFGVGHDALGAAMCETWGLAPAAVHSVRHHVAAQVDWRLPPHRAHRPHRPILALSVLAKAVTAGPDRLTEVVNTVAAQMGWPVEAVLSALQCAETSRVAATQAA